MYESYLSQTTDNQGANDYIPVTIPKQKKKSSNKNPVMKIPDHKIKEASKARKRTATTKKALSARKYKKFEF